MSVGAVVTPVALCVRVRVRVCGTEQIPTELGLLLNLQKLNLSHNEFTGP